jgi:hypothetical protein
MAKVIDDGHVLKHISRWRDERATCAAIVAGRLFHFRICRRCDHYDPLAGRCTYVGTTQGGASCDFWADADDVAY